MVHLQTSHWETLEKACARCLTSLAAGNPVPAGEHAQAGLLENE